MTEEAQYKLLRLLEHNPHATQREIAGELGVSLGKVNYCLQALIEKGLIKARNFKNSRNKAAYLYLLTPRGVKAKTKISLSYLNQKVAEYEQLESEIASLRAELGRTADET